MSKETGLHTGEHAQPNPEYAAGDDRGMPRGVEVFGVMFLIFVVAFIVLHLAGGGFRGHTSP